MASIWKARAAGRRLHRTALAATLAMSADTSKDRLRLAAGDTSIVADGSDATSVTFRATDAYGNHRPHVTGDVTLTVTGRRAWWGATRFRSAPSAGSAARSCGRCPARRAG